MGGAKAGGWRQSLESLGSQLILVYSHVIQLQMSALWVVNGPTIFNAALELCINYFQLKIHFVLHIKTVRKYCF